ncbi:MAG: hypothetical protein SWK76_12050 [Actinomycetota bacterium]|nr:hypothetical protein [Actinomycetota bacterium]
MAEHVHQSLNEEIRSVAGYYIVLEEGVLKYNGREVLFLVQAAEIDTSCCGSGGMGYIYVPGYLQSLKSYKNDSGLWVSEVERIKDEDERREIEGLLRDRYPVFQQVSFA